eukprot:TRINITY_DN11546_c0_g1_i3.p4 TRINITY_DN11546_c0_g1~~TRINITY_DN11546_c0_g1_i3.p4  ORF type:complete len:101 (-),score=5.40 TRINITY_DN11546_c0_g1_i3:643-945(-)
MFLDLLDLLNKYAQFPTLDIIGYVSHYSRIQLEQFMLLSSGQTLGVKAQRFRGHYLGGGWWQWVYFQLCVQKQCLQSYTYDDVGFLATIWDFSVIILIRC